MAHLYGQNDPDLVRFKNLIEKTVSGDFKKIHGEELFDMFSSIISKPSNTCYKKLAFFELLKRKSTHPTIKEVLSKSKEKHPRIYKQLEQIYKLNRTAPVVIMNECS